MRKFFLSVLVLLSALAGGMPVFAQQSSAQAPAASAQAKQPSDLHRLELESTLQQFARTDNTAGMGLFQPVSGSVTEINVFRQAGDYHRAQEGSSDLGFRFSTLRYDRLTEQLFMRGSFYYSYDSEKDRKWSDVIDPFYSIPYIYGSSIAKNYDRHHCGIDFDLYTTPLSDIVSVGIKVNYEVADISGRRDPRPRTGYLGLRAIPSVLLTFGQHHVGLNAGYGYSKEKLSGLTTVQSYPNLYYYRMSGLDQVEGTISGYSGFKRQFEGHRGMGELSYSWTSKNVDALVSGGFEYEALSAYGDIKQTPGKFNAFLYKLLAEVNLRGQGSLQAIRLNASYKDGGADEYLQEKVSVLDPITGQSTQTWETLYIYKNRYVMGKTDVSASYRYYGGYTGGDYRWSAGAEAGWSSYRRAYYLPFSSAGATGWNLGVEGSCLLLQLRGHKLDLSAYCKGYLHGESSLDLSNDNLYVQEVLLPDQAYYAKDYVRAGGSLSWQFPLNLGKAGAAYGYVRLCGGYLRAFPTGFYNDISLAVGLFTF